MNIHSLGCTCHDLVGHNYLKYHLLPVHVESLLPSILGRKQVYFQSTVHATQLGTHAHNWAVDAI